MSFHLNFDFVSQYFGSEVIKWGVRMVLFHDFDPSSPNLDLISLNIDFSSHNFYLKLKDGKSEL